jgi:hypothetical protein
MLTPNWNAIPEKVSPLAIACVRGVGEGEGSGVEVPGGVGVCEGVGVYVRKYSNVGVDEPGWFDPFSGEQEGSTMKSARTKPIDK